jgi:hypothetical protein
LNTMRPCFSEREGLKLVPKNIAATQSPEDTIPIRTQMLTSANSWAAKALHLVLSMATQT